MITLQAIITLLYYAMAAFAAVLLAGNFWRAKTWDREVLYLLVLIPFVLRVLLIK